MKRITLVRSFQNEAVTLGMLSVPGLERPLFTLENPWKNNKPYVSCIPAGEYECAPFNGRKYKDVYEVQYVEGRSAILFHHGNIEDHTMGCILLGLSAGELGGEPAVLSSRRAMDVFRSEMGKEKFILEIIERKK